MFCIQEPFDLYRNSLMPNFNIFKYCLVLTCILQSDIAPAQVNWKTVSTSVSFKIKNAGINVGGNFDGFNGQLFFDENALATSYLKASVNVESLETGNNLRDEHLQKANYFNTALFPKIEIASKKLYKKQNAFEELFDKTIKGKTETLIPFQSSSNGSDALFTGTFIIDRRDFNVGGNSIMLSDQVTISIIVNAKK